MANHKSLRPGDLFSEQAAAQYEEWHADIWRRIIQVHHTVLTMEAIDAYPIDRISTSSESVFWRTITQNSWHAAITTLNGLVKDKGSLTLRRLNGEMMLWVWSSPEAKLAFREELRRVAFDRKTENLYKRVKELRTHWFAHRTIDEVTGNVRDVIAGFNLKELRTIFDAVECLFQACSVGSYYQTTLSSYAPASYSYSAKGATGRPKEPLGVETILDSVARNSYFVNEPECHGALWPTLRDRIKAEDLTALNELREKVGLPRA